MTPLARAVEAMRDAFWATPVEASEADANVLLAALDVLGPVIVERARERVGYEKSRSGATFVNMETKYPDWPAIRASLTEREP